METPKDQAEYVISKINILSLFQEKYWWKHPKIKQNLKMVIAALILVILGACKYHYKQQIDEIYRTSFGLFRQKTGVFLLKYNSMTSSLLLECNPNLFFCCQSIFFSNLLFFYLFVIFLHQVTEWKS